MIFSNLPRYSKGIFNISFVILWLIGMILVSNSLTQQQSTKAVNFVIQPEKIHVGKSMPFTNINVVRSPFSKATLSWTIIIYMAGDNNLSPALLEDFNELEKVGPPNGVEIIVFIDLYGECDFDLDNDGTPDNPDDPFSEGRVYRIVQDDNPEKIGSQLLEDTSLTNSEPNMGDPNTLNSFITYCQTNYPAENYALIISNHGGGWADYGGRKSSKTSRGIAWDDHSRDNLTQNELQYVLTSKNINLLGMDACLMGLLEVVYDFRNLVDVVVFSEEYEPGDGWPYDDILRDLSKNPSMTISELATNIVSSYKQSYTMIGSAYPDYMITVSALDCEKVSAIAETVDSLAQELMNNIEIFAYQIALARAASEEFEYPEQIDLYDFVEELYKIVTNNTIKSACYDVLTAITDAVIAEAHLSQHPDANGLGIYFPSTYSVFQNSYQLILDFTADTQWDEFLLAYYQNGEITLVPGADPSTAILGPIGANYGATPLPGDSIELLGRFYSATIWFKTQVTNGSQINLSIDANPISNFDIFLFNPNNVLIDYANRDIYPDTSSGVVAQTSGKYHILVAQYSGSGEFNLTISLGEGGISPNDAIQIYSSDFILGILPGPGQTLDYDGDAQPDGGEIWYSMDLWKEDIIFLSLSGPKNRSDFDLFLYGPPDQDGNIDYVAYANEANYPDETEYKVEETGRHYLVVLAYPYGEWEGNAEFSLLIVITEGPRQTSTGLISGFELGISFVVLFAVICYSKSKRQEK